MIKNIRIPKLNPKVHQEQQVSGKAIKTFFRKDFNDFDQKQILNIQNQINKGFSKSITNGFLKQYTRKFKKRAEDLGENVTISHMGMTKRPVVFHKYHRTTQSFLLENRAEERQGREEAFELSGWDTLE